LDDYAPIARFWSLADTMPTGTPDKWHTGTMWSWNTWEENVCVAEHFPSFGNLLIWVQQNALGASFMLLLLFHIISSYMCLPFWAIIRNGTLMCCTQLSTCIVLSLMVAQRAGYVWEEIIL
jgi:hypothetical protein